VSRPPDGDERRLVRAALGALGIERFVLAIHDASFPGWANEDVGRGTPYSRGAGAFFAFAARAGFDGIQLGPQGKTSRSNPSPYDASFLARSHLSLALAPLVDGDALGGLLTDGDLARLVAGRPPGAAVRADHRWAWDRLSGAVALAHRRYLRRPAAHPEVADRLGARSGGDHDLLEADGLYEALAAHHGTDDVSRWSRGPAAALDRRLFSPPRGQAARARRRREALAARHAALLARNAFAQALLSLEHRELRARMRDLGMRLYADLQVGLALRDRWRYADLFLPGYALGAPPSRTNPDGQAWGYPVMRPDLYAAPDGGPGPALRLFERRFARLLEEFDGVRVDHPHGLVCPWVYRTDTGDPTAAVRAGARLFSSPELPDHPALARFSIVRGRDLAPRGTVARHADDWVRRLSRAQVARYALLLDSLVARVRARGGESRDVSPEVLSTCPYPLARVLDRHGLGRLRVTIKADPADARDPYRTENARPADWITLATHDTPSAWRVARDLTGTPRAAAWADYLAARLAPEESGRARLAATLAADVEGLPQAMLADLLVGPARQVVVFFADLLGVSERYNVPGVVSDRNWNLRVPPGFARLYARRRASGRALDPGAAAAAALRARARGAAGDATDLARALEQLRRQAAD
jgi:4-alpha-glucanotransferase